MSLNGFCAARECPAVLAAMLETSRDAVIRADADGTITAWSPGASHVYGHGREEAVGSPLAILVPDERRDELAEMLEQVRLGRAVADRETIHRARDGAPLHVSLSILPIADPAGRMLGVLSIARDMTALRQTESARRLSDARWQAIIDSAADDIIVIDTRGVVETFNAAAERLFGYRAEEMIGRSVNVLMPPPHRDEHDRYVAAYLAGGPAKIIGAGREVTARRRSGEDFAARLAVGEAKVDGETRFTGIIHDLTERVEMEKRLHEQAALATVGEMASVVAHQFRNGLAAVRGAVQVLGRGLPAESYGSSAVSETVARIDALTTVVRDMLLFARLPELRKTPVNIAEVVTSAAGASMADAGAGGAQVEIVGTAPPVAGDVELLRTAFLHVLSNSTQAMHGTGTIRVQIEATATSCRILFVDDGPGMPPDVRARLFSPFFTTKARGSGLGLAIVKRIVEAHDGSVRVDCPPGGGTAVTVDLPMSSFTPPA